MSCPAPPPYPPAYNDSNIEHPAGAATDNRHNTGGQDPLPSPGPLQMAGWQNPFAVRHSTAGSAHWKAGPRIQSAHLSSRQKRQQFAEEVICPVYSGHFPTWRQKLS